MGQKVHPYGFRLGVNKPWKSRWFVERGYANLLVEDVQLRRELKEKLPEAAFDKIVGYVRTPVDERKPLSATVVVQPVVDAAWLRRPQLMSVIS